LNAFFLFFTKLYDYGVNKNADIHAIFNNLIDVVSFVEMKMFFNLIGTEVYLNDAKFFFNFDFIDNVLFNLHMNFDNMKIVLFIGLNLRLEIPVLNSRFLRYSNVKFFSVGPISSYSLAKIKNIGNSFYDLVNIFKGKS